jgi:ABC-2 type transport system ATP-binding protein
MTNATNLAIQMEGLTYAYGRAEAVRDLNLSVERGRCYGLFGRNGAGKTTTMKCLLNLLRPQSGKVSVFGLDPVKHEVEVKRRLAYVPDQVAFYSWMTIRETLDYLASFRENWNHKIEQDLLDRFRLDPNQRTSGLSKGQRTQVALIAAVSPETDLLVLDEPTSGLDPIVRREFIETVIGAYQEGDPGNRTILVSTHLITEFEGLIDKFTIIDGGRSILTLESDDARGRYQKIRARFPQSPPDLDLTSALQVRRSGRELDLIVNGGGPELLERLKHHRPESLTTESLTLEEIFVATLQT